MNNSDLIPLVDADFLPYRVGHAVKEDEPLEYALATTRSAIHNIWDRFPDRKSEGKLFLGGKNNFRDKIATIQIYKGNRDPADKPRFYDDIRQYMIDYHGAEVIDGMEAEDKVGILAYAAKDRDHVIVSQDKDLKNIPGWHYNPVNEKFWYTTLQEANHHFWCQVLGGDRVDNILGIPGVGDKTALKILKNLDADWQDMHDTVLGAYEDHYGKATGWAMMDENAKLVWILRKEGETYDGSRVC